MHLTISSQASVHRRLRWRIDDGGRCDAQQQQLALVARFGSCIDDVQRKLIKWPCESYQVVVVVLLLRQFETQRMIGKHDGRPRINNNNNNNKTAPAMATRGLAHFRFRVRLLHYARAYPQCHMEIG